jgi:hypothetical protein
MCLAAPVAKIHRSESALTAAFMSSSVIPSAQRIVALHEGQCRSGGPSTSTTKSFACSARGQWTDFRNSPSSPYSAPFLWS